MELRAYVITDQSGRTVQISRVARRSLNTRVFRQFMPLEVVSRSCPRSSRQLQALTDDASHDHANRRAKCTIATSVSAAPQSTLPQRRRTVVTMLKFLRSLVPAKPNLAPSPPPTPAPAPPTVVSAPGVEDFNIVENLIDANGLPVVDWEAAQRWVDAIGGGGARATAWAACELAWLEHLRFALGQNYRLSNQGSTVLLSSLESNIADATLEFVGKSLQRVVRVLDGAAQVSEWGKNILVVFDDDETYYRYVAHYYPTAGEFAGSGGMYIHQGCGHFATVKADLRAIEPVIAHELTHACLSHLPIPAWVNEGLAVNTERRLCPPPLDTFGSRSSPRQMHTRHQKFWGATEIQEFWSGKSFLRADEGNELSYDLARILISQFAGNWEKFLPFVLAANVEDGGASAAREHLAVELGEAAMALLEHESNPNWAPNPLLWSGTPERGAFHANAS